MVVVSVVVGSVVVSVVVVSVVVGSVVVSVVVGVRGALSRRRRLGRGALGVHQGAQVVPRSPKLRLQLFSGVGRERVHLGDEPVRSSIRFVAVLQRDGAVDRPERGVQSNGVLLGNLAAQLVRAAAGQGRDRGEEGKQGAEPVRPWHRGECSNSPIRAHRPT